MQDSKKTKAQLIEEIKELRSLCTPSSGVYKELFDNSPLGIYLTSPDREILKANPVIVRMLGYESFEELSKRNLEQAVR